MLTDYPVQCFLCFKIYNLTPKQAAIAAEGHSEDCDFVCPDCARMIARLEEPQPLEDAYDRWLESGMIGSPEDYTDKSLFEPYESEKHLERVFTNWMHR